jgi:hypothetical protein
MASVFINVLVVVLFAVFAIAASIFIFAVAAKAFHEIFEAFQRSTLAGVGMLSLCALGLVAVVFGVHVAVPYVMDFYRGLTG